MYDKSKKTWSQRLKITKTAAESTTTGTTATTTSTDRESTTRTSNTKQTENLATSLKATKHIAITKTNKTKSTPQNLAYNNASNIEAHQTQYFQTLAATTTRITKMHLPTLQLSDYHMSGNGSGGGGGGGIGGGGVGSSNALPSGYEYLANPLSRSMKYAEPWIYSTVRGVPSRPTYHHFIPQATSSPSPSSSTHLSNYMQPLAAVVICSCPEYLNGTKRDVKKASVCKKCKGSRLPLAPIGGTMRLPIGGMLAMSNLRSNSGAATVRVVSTTKKSRPTILDPQKDPYDLMRRTRLLSPEPSGVTANSGGGGINGIVGAGGRDSACSNSREKDKSRGRLKSESPARGRSRKRGQLSTSSGKSHLSSGNSDLREVNDCWLVEDADALLNASGAMASLRHAEATTTRRSILRCNINPYDLISLNSMASTSPSPSPSPTGPNTPIKTISRNKLSIHTINSVATNSDSSQNEFMPPNDDDFNVADAALTEEAPPFALTTNKQQIPRATRISSTTKMESSKASLALQRESTNKIVNVNINEEVVASSSHFEMEVRSKRGYNNVQAIAGQRISLGSNKSTVKALIKQNENGRCCESIKDVNEMGTKDVLNAATIVTAKTTTNTPQLMSKQSTEAGQHTKSQEDTKTMSAKIFTQPKRPPHIRKSESSENAVGIAEQNTIQNDMSKSTSTARIAGNGDGNGVDEDNGNSDDERVMLLMVTPTQNIKSILKRPTATTTASTLNAESGSEVNGSIVGKDQKITLVLSGSNGKDDGKPKTTYNTNQRRANAIQHKTNATNSPTPTTKSQFYIPLPQARKKVQFLVEERIVHALESDTNSSDEAIEVSTTEEESLFDRNCDDIDDDGGKVMLDNGDANRQTHQYTKSNYDYYQRKREKRESLQCLENVNAMATADPLNSDGRTMRTMLPSQDALLAELQKYSDLMSQVIAQANSNNNNMNSNNSSNNNNSNQNLAETASAEIRATRNCNATKSTHYEDINPINIDDNKSNNNNNARQQHCEMEQDENTTTNMNTNNKIMSLGSGKILLTQQQNADGSTHSLKAINTEKTKLTTTTAPEEVSSSTSPSTSLMPTTATNAQSSNGLAIVNTAIGTNEADDVAVVVSAPLSLVACRNDDDYDDDGNNEGQCNLKKNNNSNNNNNNNNKTNVESSDEDIYEDANDDNSNNYNVTTPTLPPPPTDDDDVLRTKLGVCTTTAQKRRTKRAKDSFTRVGDDRENGLVVNNSNANKVEEQPQATQSRNPIERSQSERRLRTTITTTSWSESKTNNGKSKNNNNNNVTQPDGDHKTNGNVRLAAVGVSAGSSCSSKNHNNNNNKHNNNTRRKLECQREEAILSFKDTMALRIKLQRKDSRDLFARPREPPPPPPTQTTNTSITFTEADDVGKVTAARQTASTDMNSNFNNNTNTDNTNTKTKTKCGNEMIATTHSNTKDMTARVTLITTKPSTMAELGSPVSTITVPSTQNYQTNMTTTGIGGGAGKSSHSKTTKVSTNGLEVEQQQPTKREQITEEEKEVERIEDGRASTKIQATQLACGSHADSSQCDGQQKGYETKAQQQQTPQKHFKCTHNAWETAICAITSPTTTHTTAGGVCLLSSTSDSCDSFASCANNLHVKINTSPEKQQQQRTIVRVAPFNKTKTNWEVHRLKISYTDNPNDGGNGIETETNGNALTTTTHTQTISHKSPTSPHYNFHYNTAPLNGRGSKYDGLATTTTTTTDLPSPTTIQKKTSILINGDDCYSTMNLSCDDTNTPHYQSSVVVADYSVKSDATSTTTTTNLTNDSAAQVCAAIFNGHKVTTTANTVTINVSSPRSAAEELIYQHNKINKMLNEQAGALTVYGGSKLLAPNGSGRAIIPIKGTAEVSLQRSASSTSSTSTSSMTSISSNSSGAGDGSSTKRSRTLIKLDYEPGNCTIPTSKQEQSETNVSESLKASTDGASADIDELLIHEEELLKILRNPVEAVKRNLVPHVCRRGEPLTEQDTVRNRKMKDVSKTELLIGDTKSANFSVNSKILKTDTSIASQELAATSNTTLNDTSINTNTNAKTSFITKLLEDPMLSQVADGLEIETVAELIENSLKRLQETRNAVDMSGTKDSDDMNRLIKLSLQKVKEERQYAAGANATASTSSSTAITSNRTTSNMSSANNNTHLTIPTLTITNTTTVTKDEDGLSNRGSISSANSFASASNYELFDFDANESDCYQSCSSEITSPGDDCDLNLFANKRSKFYQMLVDATLAEIEMSTNMEDMEDIGSHHYESIRSNVDPIYEEINDVPPPLPLSAPPPINDTDVEKKAARSIFEGASKYDILSYLVDAKERGVVREESSDYPLNTSNPIIIEEEACDTLSELGKRQTSHSRAASVMSDSSEDAQSVMSSLSPPTSSSSLSQNGNNLSVLLHHNKCNSSDIERNDSGVGSESSKSSRSKYQNPLAPISAKINSKDSPIHLCEDCDGPVEMQVTESGIMFAPLVCRKCGKKRVERKEIITEIVETEEKYGRDLQIILEEFCHPMLVAGLLTQEQLSAIFLNTEELLENNQTLAERMRDALDIALEQGDDDLLTVNIGKIFLDFTQMLHAFESYCVRQAGASLLLANLEKEKELLRIFLKVSQMENTVLRRMNLNSFLMVPVQRVTKYPLLLARLYKVTPSHLEGRDQLKQAQEKIELHLNHINQEAKDVPTKLWRRISSSSPNRRASCEIDMINIKLRKMAIDILEWNHDEVRFVMEGKLLYTQPTDNNWKKARTIKLTPVNALLVTNGKPSANYKAEKVMSDKLNFPKHTGIREASLLVVKEKCGRYTLIREPLYLDRCVVCSEADLDDYFEVQEISSKDTFIFKAEDGVRTKQWYTQMQYHAQGMGAWRKRRNALANIMINGMLTRT